jgi:hypothetical protein
MKVEVTYSTTKVLRYKTYIDEHVALTIKKVKYLIVYNACEPVLQMNECSYHEGGGRWGSPRGGGICTVYHTACLFSKDVLYLFYLLYLNMFCCNLGAVGV